MNYSGLRPGRFRSNRRRKGSRVRFIERQRCCGTLSERDLKDVGLTRDEASELAGSRDELGSEVGTVRVECSMI